MIDLFKTCKVSVLTASSLPVKAVQPEITSWAAAVHTLLSNRSATGCMSILGVELVSTCDDLSVVKFSLRLMSGCVRSCANLYPDLRLFGEVGNAVLRYRPRVAANDQGFALAP